MTGDKKGMGCAIGMALFVILLIYVMFSSIFGSCGTGSKEKHECYVCGKEADRKVGSHWYCSKHAAWVEAVADDV